MKDPPKIVGRESLFAISILLWSLWKKVFLEDFEGALCLNPLQFWLCHFMFSIAFSSILSDIGRNYCNSNIGLILWFRHLAHGLLVLNASAGGIYWTISSWNAQFLIHWKDCCLKTSQDGASDKFVIPDLANANFFEQPRYSTNIYLFSF